MSSEQYSDMAMAGKPHNEQSNSQNTPTFSVSKILYCSPHGNMSKKPARFHDLTSAFPNADTLSANDFIAAGELAYKELPKNDDTKELYRATKTSMLSFSITATPSIPLATFRTPLFSWVAVPINFVAAPSALQQQQQHSTILVSQSKSEKVRFSRSHSFVHNSCSYSWSFASGTEIHLQALHEGSERVVARFFFPPSWFKSSGVLVIGRAEEESEANWETVVVVTLLVVLRREREWRYALAGNVFPMKRTFV